MIKSNDHSQIYMTEKLNDLYDLNQKAKQNEDLRVQEHSSLLPFKVSDRRHLHDSQTLRRRNETS